jgi:hypothetical protein
VSGPAEGGAARDGAPRDDVQRTRRMGLPPVPGTPQPPVLADQPTIQHPPSDPRQHTSTWGEWQPLQPRVVPRERSRARIVVPVLVLLVILAAVVVALVFRR